jgi:hypothetical protein
MGVIIDDQPGEGEAPAPPRNKEDHLGGVGASEEALYFPKHQEAHACRLMQVVRHEIDRKEQNKG